MMAVRRNNTDVVVLLIERGADVSLKDSDDRTCLFIAAEEDCVDTFKVNELSSPKLIICVQAYKADSAKVFNW